MPTKDPQKKAEANRKRQARYREKHKNDNKPSGSNAKITPKKGVTPPPITQEDFDKLPLSLKVGFEQETRRRQILKMPLEIEKRREAVVRRFRGY